MPAGPVARHPAPGGRAGRDARRRRLASRATRSLIGSIVAAAVSEAVFAGLYGFGVLGTTGCSAVAFLAGAVPNYVLNRRWAWRRRGRVRVGREVVLYVAVSLASFGASAVATAWMSHQAPRLAGDHLVRVALVSGAYLGTYALLFGLKFAAYELVIFGDPDSEPETVRGPSGGTGDARRSRHHVPAMTRAKRQP